MSNGTSGDVNNVDFRTCHRHLSLNPFEQINFAAELLTQDVCAKACEKLEYRDSIPLKVRQQEIVVGVRRPTPDDVKAAEKKLAAVSERPLKELSDIYARETQ